MNIMIKIGYQFVTVAPAHTEALIALLPHLRAVESSGYGESLTYTMAEMPPEVSFEDSSKLTSLNEREKALASALEKKNSDWATAYNERDKHAARIKELERELVEARESQS